MNDTRPQSSASIVERLREGAHPYRYDIMDEAADEIERLTAENAELRAALQIWMQGRTLEQTPDQTQGQK